MSEVIAEYKVKVNSAVSELDAAAKAWQKVDDANTKANKTATDGFIKGSDGAKRLNSELQKQPKTLAELELKLQKLRELLRDDTEIGTKGFKQVSAEIKKTEQAVDEANGKLGEMSKQGNGMMSVFKKLGGVLLAAFAVDKIISYGKEAVELAAKAEGIRTAFSKLDSPNLLANLRKATRGAVTDVELMRQAIRANNFQVPLEKLGTFFEFATKRSIETGESVDYLVSSIIDGIGRKSTLVLDNLGISATQLQEEIKKTGDFGQAAANIIEKSLSETGDVADTTAVKMAQLSTATENLKTALGALVAEQARPVITFLTNVAKAIEDDITELDRFTEKIRAQSGYRLLGTQVEETAKLVELEKEATEAAGKVRDAEFRKILAKVDAQRKVVDAIKLELKARLDNNEEIEITTDLIDKEIAAYKARNEVTERTVITLNSLGEELKVLKDELANAELGSSAFWNILDRLDAKIKQLTDAEALTKLADALKIDSEGDSLTSAEFERVKMISQADYDLYQEKKKNREEFDKWLSDKIAAELQAEFDKGEKLAELARQRYQDEIDLQNMQREMTQEFINVNFQAWQSLTNSIAELSRAQYDRQLSGLENLLKKGLITQEEYDKRRASLAREQFKKDKEAKIIQASINTALGVTNAIATAPNIIVGLILAAVAAAAGAAEIAVISSAPVPQFKDGGMVKEHGLLKGKSHAQGGIPIEAEGNEYFMPTKPTLKNYGLLEAMRKGVEEQYILKHYKGRFIDDAIFNGFADIGKSAQLNGVSNNWKGHNLVEAIDRDRQSTTRMLGLIHNELKAKKRNDRYA